MGDTAAQVRLPFVGGVLRGRKGVAEGGFKAVASGDVEGPGIVDEGAAAGGGQVQTGKWEKDGMFVMQDADGNWLEIHEEREIGQGRQYSLHRSWWRYNPNMRLDDGQIEVMDLAMVPVLRQLTGLQRLQSASGMFSSARTMVQSYLRQQHPQWSARQIGEETSRRLVHGADRIAAPGYDIAR